MVEYTNRLCIGWRRQELCYSQCTSAVEERDWSVKRGQKKESKMENNVRILGRCSQAVDDGGSGQNLVCA